MRSSNSKFHLAVFEEEFPKPACLLFTSVRGTVTIFLALEIMVFELQAPPCLCDERIESGSRELSWSVNWYKKKKKNQRLGWENL